MPNFGWSYPAGCSGTPYDDFPPEDCPVCKKPLPEDSEDSFCSKVCEAGYVARQKAEDEALAQVYKCMFACDECHGELWTCEYCGDNFCQLHSHQTVNGKNVECCACEHSRPDYERDYGHPRPKLETLH